MWGLGPLAMLTSWLDKGRVYVECLMELPAGVFGPLPPCFFSREGAGRWQNFPVELEGHQHSSRPTQRPPFRQGI